MTREHITEFEYDDIEKRYYLNFKAGGDAFYIVKDYVKSFGKPASEFVKMHTFKSGAQSACWKVSAFALERVHPAFTNLEEMYEAETGESWGSFLRRDEKILGIKFRASARTRLEEEHQAKWEDFQENWEPDESYRQSKARQASRKRSGTSTSGSSQSYSRSSQHETPKHSFEDQVREAWEKAFDEEVKHRKEENARAEEARRKAREEAVKNVRESTSFVRVELPKSPYDALVVLGFQNTSPFSLKQAELKKAFQAQIKRYHPDLHRFADEATQKECEIKIRQINAAYEMLLRYAA